MAYGPADTQNIVGSISSNPFPVALSATDNAVLDTIDAVLDTIKVDTEAIETAVEILDNAISGGEMQVDVITMPSTAVTNTGTFAVQVVDTSFAVADGNTLGEGVLIQGDDGTDRKNINVDASTGDVQVDITNTVTVDGSAVTQPVSGTVTANLSATDNAVLDVIAAATHVDDAGFTLGTHRGVMLMGFAGAQSVNANDAGALRMETDGALHVDVQNEATVALSATDNAVLDTIDAVLDTIKVDTEAIETAVEILDNAISGSEMQVDVITLPALVAGTALIGSVFQDASASSIGSSTFYDADLDETKIEVTDNPNVRIYSIHAMNTTAAPLFLQLWDLDADSVTVGTTAPTNQYIIPGNADSDGAGFEQRQSVLLILNCIAQNQ